MGTLNISMKHYVYQLRLANCAEPFYIGKGKDGRAYDHLRETKHRTRNHMKHSIIKHANESSVEVLVEFIATELSEETALRLEVCAIKMWGRLSTNSGPLTNLTGGGEGGNTLSDPLTMQRFKESMSAANALPETRANRKSSARKMWENEEFRKRMELAKRNSYIANPSQRHRKMFIGWDQADDKWLQAKQIYIIWIKNGSPSHKRLAKILIENGFPKYHLQKMINYFKTVNILTDPLYEQWIKTKTQE